MQTATVAPVAPGFSDLTIQSQSAFRAIMKAMAEPGLIVAAPEPVPAPAPLSPVAAMVALTLCDYDTPVWLDAGLGGSERLKHFLTFHTGAPLTADKKQAAFAFIADAAHLEDLSSFAPGSDEYPDQSTTLVIQAGALTNAAGAVLEGPGIETSRHFSTVPLPSAFWAMAKANHALYPRGVDLIFVIDNTLACLPRSTRIKGA